jgi:peptide/nickel transport system permease protein
MLSFIVRRIFYLIPVLLIVSVMVFTIFRMIPGDPVDAFLGMEQDPQVRSTLRAQFGLDKPLPVQYFYWVNNLLHGNFGKSLSIQKNVLTLLSEKIPNTIYLACSSVFISILIAIPAGIVAATRRKKAEDYAAMTFALLGISIPGFWLGIMFILIFSLYLGWFPSMGFVSPFKDPLRSLWHLALPALSLGWLQAAIITRLTRSSMLDVLNREYVRTARAQGHSEKKVVFRYALKNALIPVVTVVGLRLAALLGGTIVIEQIFSWPGVGLLLLQAIYARDYPLVQGAVLIIAVGFVLINLLVDIAYQLIDPRIRMS